MRTMTLGRTNIPVSAVGLGGIQFSKIPKREVAQVIGTAREEGINFLETAHGYFDSEEKIGAAIAKKREGLVLASKSGPRDGKTFSEHLDDSLRRLRTDMIDVYQLHGVDDLEALNKAMGKRGAVRAAERAIKDGKIRSLGITSHSLDVCLHVLKEDLFDTIQYPISLINTEVPRSGLLGLARRRNVGLIAMKPLGGGRLNNARLALGYIYRHPRVVPVVGVETPEQVRELARIASRPPKLGQKDYEKIRRLRKTVGTTFCRACRYCEPCPQGITIYRAMYFPVYISQMGVKAQLGKGVPEWLEKVEECTECRQCEKRCPFHLEIVKGIRQSLEQARRLAAGGSARQEKAAK